MKMFASVKRQERRWLSLLAFLIVTAGTLSANARAGVTLAPQTRDDLVNLVKSLAEDHPQNNWCKDACSQIHKLKLSGTIASGILKLEIDGAVAGKKNAVLPLFGSAPAVDIPNLKDDETEAPLVFHNKTYYTFLAPGPFHLVGEIKIERSATVNFTLPGAVGSIVLDIPDQEPLLAAIPKGQKGGSFQIVPALKPQADQPKKQEALRLGIVRSFTIERDKTFTYTFNVSGARAGQVISVPLTHGEKVLAVDPPTATITKDKVDFTATAGQGSFVIDGEWTESDIKQKAPTGAIQETWEIACEGGYDCLFAGDAEKKLLASTHQWAPLPGQSLHATWKELGTLPGQSIVSQTTLLKTERKGTGLKQTLAIQLTSSASDQLFIDLPAGAIDPDLSYGSTSATILKNAKGQVHLSVPEGTQIMSLTWELPEAPGIALPLPKVSVPTGKWVYWLTPNDNENAFITGGPAGSPVVLFWPRLGFCLFIGLAFLYGEKRLTGVGGSWLYRTLFLIVAAGYALVSPLELLAVTAFATVVRLIARVKQQRTIFGWLFEGGVVLVVTALVFMATIDLLDTAFFASYPFKVDNFCAGSSLLGHYQPYQSLCWEVPLANPTATLVAPYAIMLPTLLMRLLYFGWAIVAGIYLYRELVNLGRAVVRYYKMGTRPVIAKSTPAAP